VRREIANRAATYSARPRRKPGTKRLSNLLHSSKWTAQVVEDELWQQADQQVEKWREQGEDAAFDLGEQ